MTQNFKALSTGLIIGLVSITSGSIYAGGLTAQQVTQITGGNNTITTAVPFLNIAPDSRTQGMADVGVATSPDANSSAVNPAKLAFIDKPAGFAVSYTPWLRQLVPDMNLAYLSGFYKLDKDQVLSSSLRYFSMGDITFTDNVGNNIGQFRPNEFALDGSYARKLSPKFSGAITARYIYSNLTDGYSAQGASAHPGMAFAVDLSGYYQNPKVKIGDTKSTYAAGFDISNIGNKIEYSSSTERDFLPINLKVGNSLTMNLDDYNSLCFAIDLNKLLVPTAIYAQNSAGNPITNPITGAQEVAYGQDPSSTSVPAGIFGSFTDMPGGIKEQLKEIDYAFGMEYWYDKQFAVRAGYFYEDATFGNRRFFTLGTGLKYNVFALDFSYLIPTDQRNPLQNTLCFTLFFNFDALKSGSEEAEKKD